MRPTCQGHYYLPTWKRLYVPRHAFLEGHTTIPTRTAVYLIPTHRLDFFSSLYVPLYSYPDMGVFPDIHVPTVVCVVDHLNLHAACLYSPCVCATFPCTLYYLEGLLSAFSSATALPSCQNLCMCKLGEERIRMISFIPASAQAAPLLTFVQLLAYQPLLPHPHICPYYYQPNYTQLGSYLACH